MKRTIFSLALLLFSTSLSAQENPCLRRVLPVSVVGSDGAPVAGLTAENFRGSFRGAPVQIVSAKFGARPIRLVILLDLSGSMGHAKKNLVAELLISQALLAASNGSKVALIAFADKVKFRTGLRQDTQAVADALRDINLTDSKSFSGQTRLWDAVGEAFNLLNPPQPGGAVYAVTDGEDRSSNLQMPVIEEALLGSGLRFFAFLVPSNERDWFLSADERPAPTKVEVLAETTGGNVFNLRPAGPYGPGINYDLSPEGKKIISEAAGALYKQMQVFYLIEISLMQAVDKPRSWKLQVVPTDKQQVKGLSLHYPQKLFPCTAAKDAQQPTLK